MIFEPSGFATMASRCRRPLRISAAAPIGTWQPPPSLFNKARSQVVAARAAGSSKKARSWRVAASPARISIPRAPWPAARTHDFFWNELFHQFRLAQPIQACGRQDDRFIFTIRSFRRRVSTLPRKG